MSGFLLKKRFGLVVYFFLIVVDLRCVAPPCEYKGLLNMTMVCSLIVY